MQEAPLPVEVEVPGDSARRERGDLTFIDNSVDVSTGRIKLKATFQNTDNSLWPGQFAQTTLTVSTLTNAVIVPSQAIQSSQSGDFVFVVKLDATIQKRPIVSGLSRGGTTVITSGVTAGETVVTDGQLRLVEGARVSVQKGSGQ
jgi:multidrug efflux system membrane fusion protein